MSAVKDIFEELQQTLNIDDSSVTIHDDRTYDRILKERNLGLGESYMDGWWDCSDLDGLFYQIQRAQAGPRIKWSLWTKIRFLGIYLYSLVFNIQSYSKSLKVGVQHYDLGEELYSRMLDRNMCYSCGYWDQADGLDEAQINKMDLICRKLSLSEGMTVLDIGCGWGGFAKYASIQYGCKVLGITISHSQLQYCKENNSNDNTEFLFMDYRELLGSEHECKYDRVVSVGMMEHVGGQNYQTYMSVINAVLKEDGMALIHTIGGRDIKLLADPWYNTYIFPNSVLPTLSQIARATEQVAGNPLVIEDVHNFGHHYDKTLMCWYHNFTESFDRINEDRLSNGKTALDDRFVRMWTYYLLSSAGMFRARDIQLYQVVLSKGGVVGGYRSIR